MKKIILINILCLSFISSVNAENVVSEQDRQQERLIQFIAQEEQAIASEQGKINELLEMIKSAESKNGVNVITRNTAFISGVGFSSLTGIHGIGRSSKIQFVVAGIIMATGLGVTLDRKYEITLTDAELTTLNSRLKVVQTSMNSRLKAVNNLKSRIGIDLKGYNISGTNTEVTPLIIPQYSK